jgi:hypothetical protein
MGLIGHMNYFAVNECGLYRYQDSKPHGCDLTETFALISQWGAGRTMADTLPWDPSSSRTGVPKCYLHDVYHDEKTADFLLVLWKSDTDNSGTLLGAQESGTVGDAPVIKYTDSYRGKKVIWGRPCYYWVVPKLETIISIKFDHSVCDSQMMQDWVTACITLKVDHPNKVRETTESGQIRLSFCDQSDSYRYRYGFDLSLRTLSTSNAELSSLAASVTHIVRRETIVLSSQKDERAEWIKLFDQLPYLAPRPKVNRRQVEIRAEAKPTVSEIRTIIEKFAREDRRPSDWENVGFGTEKGITWVDRYRIKNNVDIDHDTKRGAITAVELFEQLEKERTRYLAPLAKARSSVGRGRR